MTQAASEPTLLQRLAERVCAFGPAQMTPHAATLARTAIIDTLGVALAGSAEACTTNLLRIPGIAEAPGPCTLFGTDRKASALDAAFVNGTASHALDYDDFSEPFGGHQSVPLLAPLVAVAEERRLSGARLIEAYVVGIEAEIRLARAVNFHHYDKGWHPTATLGIFGTVAAVGHLIGMDEARLTVAFAIAASLASGVKANFGTMVKPLHVGQSCRNGVLAVMLAEAGYDANPAALEHKQGFLNAFNGPALGVAAGGDQPDDGAQAVSMLRQHAPGYRADAGAAPGGGRERGDGGADRGHGAPPPPAAHRQPRPAHQAGGEVLRAIRRRPRLAGRRRAARRFRERPAPGAGGPGHHGQDDGAGASGHGR
jgi:2-methylcitrate dehydratase PrpD